MDKRNKLNLIVSSNGKFSLPCALWTIFFVSNLFITKSFAADLDNNPSLDQLSGIAGRIFNALIYASGAVLVAMVAYGVIKASLAAGDPRGLEGAKQTWTYAIYGFFIIILFFAIFLIIARVLGINSITSPGSVLNNIFDAINDLLSVPNSSYY
ncbi:MAG: hypothetical protein WAX66_02080 [Patescibacteria group bacterium]|jgi:hypothetical protein